MDHPLPSVAMAEPLLDRSAPSHTANDAEPPTPAPTLISPSVQPPSVTAFSKWTHIPFQDISFLSDPRMSPPWAAAPTDIFEHHAILDALNTAAGNSAFANCTQDTEELTAFRGVLRKVKNPDHLTPSEKITILMAADYLYVLWRANIPRTYHSVTQSQLKASVAMYPNLAASATQRFLHYKKVVSNKSFVNTPARFPPEIGDAIDLAYQTYSVYTSPTWFYTLVLSLTQPGATLLLRTSALTIDNSIGAQSAGPSPHLPSKRLRSTSAVGQASAAQASSLDDTEMTLRPTTPLKGTKRTEKPLPEIDVNTIRDLARQQELQFDAINSRIASLASESNKHGDLTEHPIMASLLSDVQSVKSQLQSFLTAYSSRDSDTSYMTPQWTAPDEEDIVRNLCLVSGCHLPTANTDGHCVVHTNSTLRADRVANAPTSAQHSMCSVLSCHHYAVVTVGGVRVCALHTQMPVDTVDSLETDTPPPQSLCSHRGCNRLVDALTTSCALHAQIDPLVHPVPTPPTQPTQADAAAVRSNEPAPIHTQYPCSPLSPAPASDKSDSVVVVSQGKLNPVPDPIVISEIEAPDQVFADFEPAMTPARYMASLPKSQPTPARADHAAEARTRMIDACAALKAYCLKSMPSAPPDRRPEGTYPPASSHGSPWALLQTQASWMPDYAKWRNLSLTYTAKHYKEPETPYTDACLIQLNEFELPDGLTVPQRRKFHKMALARCVTMLYGLDHMTVSCAIARHVMDTYELLELQAPITPIKFLLEPVPEVLAFFRAVTEADPLPLYAQDAHPYVTMHDRDQAKEFSRLRLANSRSNPDSDRQAPKCFKCGQPGHFASSCQSSGSSSRRPESTQSGPACTKCGQQGHTAYKCREALTETQKSSQQQRQHHATNDDWGVINDDWDKPFSWDTPNPHTSVAPTKAATTRVQAAGTSWDTPDDSEWGSQRAKETPSNNARSTHVASGSTTQPTSKPRDEVLTSQPASQGVQPLHTSRPHEAIVDPRSHQPSDRTRPHADAVTPRVDSQQHDQQARSRADTSAYRPHRQPSDQGRSNTTAHASRPTQPHMSSTRTYGYTMPDDQRLHRERIPRSPPHAPTSHRQTSPDSRFTRKRHRSPSPQNDRRSTSSRRRRSQSRSPTRGRSQSRSPTRGRSRSRPKPDTLYRHGSRERAGRTQDRSPAPQPKRTRIEDPLQLLLESQAQMMESLKAFVHAKRK